MIGLDTHNQHITEIRNVKNLKEQIKKQYGKEPEPEIEAESRRKARDGGLMKYYAHKEPAGSPNNLKRYDLLINFEKTPGRNSDEQK
jgi:hypothetical protein